MENKNKIYISGAVTGIEISAVLFFEKAERKLKGQGFEVVNPMTIEHNHDLTWNSYMRVDLKALLDCDYIFMLSNWKGSRGAKIEHQLALDLEMGILFQSEIE
jgi:hypothetical protein